MFPKRMNCYFEKSQLTLEGFRHVLCSGAFVAVSILGIRTINMLKIQISPTVIIFMCI